MNISWQNIRKREGTRGILFGKGCSPRSRRRIKRSSAYVITYINYHVTDASRTTSSLKLVDSNFGIKCQLHSPPLFRLRPLSNVNFQSTLTKTMNQPTHPNSRLLLKRAQGDQHGLLDRISLLQILAVLVDWALDHRLLPNRALLRCLAIYPLPLRRAQLARQAHRPNQQLLAMSPSQ